MDGPGREFNHTNTLSLCDDFFVQQLGWIEYDRQAIYRAMRSYGAWAPMDIAGQAKGLGTQEEEGWRYDGYFNMDEFHGPGALRYVNGDCLWASWEFGVPRGRFVFEFVHGEALVGVYNSGLPEGSVALFKIGDSSRRELVFPVKALAGQSDPRAHMKTILRLASFRRGNRIHACIILN